MKNPRLEVDLCKIRHNAQTLVGRLTPRGLGITAVTKAVCGNPAIARAMLEGGAVGLAEARLRNVRRLREAGLTCAVTLIRTPMLSEAAEVVRLCETSFNSDLRVISALSAEFCPRRPAHGIILMVEMGDLREGILPEELGALALRVRALPGVVLQGIGANFACFGGQAPEPAIMMALSDIVVETERTCGVILQTVSGDNSANLPWAMGAAPTGRITDLRLGEAILLGLEPVSGDRIAGLHTDAITLVAEVIEAGFKSLPSRAAKATASGRRIRPSRTTRLILALGVQDTDVQGLVMPVGATFVGPTSGHLVVVTQNALPRPGGEMRFQLNYSALMRAMAAPDVETVLRCDRPPTDASYAVADPVLAQH